MVVRYDPMPMDGNWFTYSDVKSNGDYKYPPEKWNTWRYIRINSRTVAPGATRDIAYEPKSATPGDGVIWLAVSDDTVYPIKSFKGNQPSSSTVEDRIAATVGIGNDIHGLAYQTGENGERFLWANNMSEKKIYKIDLDKETSVVGMNGQAGTLKDVAVMPFITGESVLLTWSGFAEKVTVRIYSMAGKLLQNRRIPGETLNLGNEHTLSSGVYVIEVSDFQNRVGVSTFVIP